MQPEPILEDLWSRSTGDTVFLPRMRNGAWIEGDPYDVRAALNAVKFLDTDNYDQYFTPLTYTGTSRRKGMLGLPGVIYADLDGEHKTDLRLQPSLIVMTSSGHAHAYWYLTQPADPAEWEKRAKGWSQEIGADPGGWDATQVLRLPGSLNHKYEPSVPVTATLWRPERVYQLEEFPPIEVSTGSVGQPEPVPSQAERDYLIKAGIEDDRLPLSARYWLTASEQEIKRLGQIDRSKVMWQVEKALVSAGYTAYEIFHLMFFAGINKFRGRPDRLWYEVQKASAGS